MSQQPVMVYPNTLTQQQQQQQQQPPSNHSNGSFGAVFIVLAVIVVISAIACFLGRLCSRRYHQRPKATAAKHNHHSKKPKERPEAAKHNQTFPGEARDIEFGYDQKGMGPNPQAFRNGSGRQGSGHHHHQHQIHQPHGPSHHGGGGGGEMRGEYEPKIVYGHEGEVRAGVEYYNPA